MSPTSRKMTHPLTDEMIIELIGDRNLFHCLTEDDMRAAADWQLEQCVEELECLLSVFGATGVVKEEAVLTMVELFRSNMRPQEES